MTTRACVLVVSLAMALLCVNPTPAHAAYCAVPVPECRDFAFELVPEQRTSADGERMVCFANEKERDEYHETCANMLALHEVEQSLLTAQRTILELQAKFGPNPTRPTAPAPTPTTTTPTTSAVTSRKRAET